LSLCANEPPEKQREVSKIRHSFFFFFYSRIRRPRDDWPRDRGRRRPPGGRLSRAAARRRLRVRRAGAGVPNHGAGARQGAPKRGRPVPDFPVGEQHFVPGPRHADGAQSQRLLRRVPDRGPRPRVRRGRRRLVRPSAAGLADPGLQRSPRECTQRTMIILSSWDT